MSLAQMDAGGEEVDQEATPSLLAAAIVQKGTAAAGDAAATLSAVRRLLAQVVGALEDVCLHHRSARSDFGAMCALRRFLYSDCFVVPCPPGPALAEGKKPIGLKARGQFALTDSKQSI